MFAALARHRDGGKHGDGEARHVGQQVCRVGDDGQGVRVDARRHLGKRGGQAAVGVVATEAGQACSPCVLETAYL